MATAVYRGFLFATVENNHDGKYYHKHLTVILKLETAPPSVNVQFMR